MENRTDPRGGHTGRPTSTEDELRISYQGWSGCTVRARSTAVPLFFDPPPDAEVEAVEATLLITHGHPEHVGGALAHLRRAGRPAVTVVASKHVCGYLERRSSCPEDRFEPVEAGSVVEAGGWEVRVFEWEHMSLLPPGAGPAARYAFQLMKHPRALAGVALGGITGPRHAPMLGFAVRAPGSAGWLVYYGEGVHRLTTREQLRAALGGGPIAGLVFGVEPEDAHALPDLLAGQDATRMLAFEPHRPWRAAFDLPQIDLDDLIAKLRAVGVDARPLAAGGTVSLSAGARDARDGAGRPAGV